MKLGTICFFNLLLLITTFFSGKKVDEYPTTVWHRAVYNHGVFIGFDSIVVEPAYNPYWSVIPEKRIHDDTAAKRGGYLNDTIITVINYPLFWDRDTLISNIREYPVEIDSITRDHLFNQTIADWDIDSLTQLLRCASWSSANVSTRIQRDIFNNGELIQCDTYTFQNPWSWYPCDTTLAVEHFIPVRQYNDYPPRSFRQLFKSTRKDETTDIHELPEIISSQWRLENLAVTPEMFATLCVWLLSKGSEELDSRSEYVITTCLWYLPDNVYNIERWLKSLDKRTRKQIVEQLFVITCRAINAFSNDKSTKGIMDVIAHNYPLFMLFCDRLGMPVQLKDDYLICGSCKYVWEECLADDYIDPDED